MSRPEPGAARFCTEHSLGAGEPLAGWGGHPPRNLLLRWPKAKWRHSLRLAAGMDAATEAAIERAVAAGWRVNLIDRKAEPSGTLRAFVHPGAMAFDLAPRDLPAFLDAVPQGAAALARFGPRAAPAPLVLCCTHGRHDRCCAKWGFGVYRALAAAAADRGGFDVWEATHLGGCRLAAGVLVLPSLRKYGRLRPEDAPALLAAEARGLPYLPCYRGASHLAPPAQVAEVTGLRHLAAAGLRGRACVAEGAPDGTARRFRVAVGGATVELRVTPREIASYGACSDLDAAAAVAPRTTWHGEVLSVTSSGFRRGQE